MSPGKELTLKAQLKFSLAASDYCKGISNLQNITMVDLYRLGQCDFKSENSYRLLPFAEEKFPSSLNTSNFPPNSFLNDNHFIALL
jgi:hypothetical protein